MSQADPHSTLPPPNHTTAANERMAHGTTATTLQTPPASALPSALAGPWEFRAASRYGAPVVVRPWQMLRSAAKDTRYSIDALLIQGPIQPATLRALTERAASGFPPKYTALVGLGGVNTQCCELGDVETYCATARKHGGVVEILPAAVTRAFLFPARTYGKVGALARQAFKWSVLSNMAHPRQGLVIRITTANLRVLGTTIAATTTTTDACRVGAAEVALGNSEARKYVAYLRRAGHFSVADPSDAAQAAEALRTARRVGSAPSVVDHGGRILMAGMIENAEADSNEQTLLVVATLKFAILHALTGGCPQSGPLYAQGEFVVPSSKKFCPSLGGIVSPRTIAALTEAMSATEGLTPCYDLTCELCMVFLFTTGKLFTEVHARGTDADGARRAEATRAAEWMRRMIRTVLVNRAPGRVTVVPRARREEGANGPAAPPSRHGGGGGGGAPLRVLTLNDFKEEADDQAALQFRTRCADASLAYETYVTGGEFSPLARLGHILELLDDDNGGQVGW